MTIFGKTDHLHTFCILRNTIYFEIFNELYLSCGTVQSGQISDLYEQCSDGYSYYFLANSTSYLNAAGFPDRFFQFL